MNRSQLSIAIAAVLLSGCAVVDDKQAPELRAKVVLPLCLQHCEVQVHVTEEGGSAPPQ